ncbi:MAG: hypothetical protein ACKOAD_00410 [Gammaproteobacteria bacterium]
MLDSIELIKDSRLGDYVFTETDLSHLFGGSPARKYALVHKALASKELIRLHRGVYMLSPKYLRQKFGKFFVASHVIKNSYISFESALSYHGWIPERVEGVLSAIGDGRTRAFPTPFGEFSYRKIASETGDFYTGVLRMEEDGYPFLIASPLRALADYIYERKIQWTELDFLTDGLRIELDSLNTLNQKNFEEIIRVYRNKRVLDFIKNLKQSLELHATQ